MNNNNNAARWTLTFMVLLLSNVAYSASSPPTARPEKYFSMQLGTGGAYNFPSYLEFAQAGQPPISTIAHFQSRPFTLPPYYQVRLSRLHGNKRVELEFVHHKLYLQNEPAGVQHFEATNGYNLIFVNGGYHFPYVDLRLGMGVIIPHPESTVRQQTFDQKGGFLNRGYYLSGLAWQAAISKQVYLSNNFYLFGEGKFTAAIARTVIVDGRVFVPNYALHGLIGFGYDLV